MVLDKIRFIFKNVFNVRCINIVLYIVQITLEKKNIIYAKTKC